MITKRLVDACLTRNKSTSLFIQHCLKDPEHFFEIKNLTNEFNSLSKEEKECFSDKEKFFNLLVIFDYKKDSTYINTTNTCKNCGNKVPFISISHGYKSCCCKKCSNELREKTNSKKYGSPFIFQIQEFKDKSKETSLEKYGVTHHNKIKSINQKQFITKAKNNTPIIGSEEFRRIADKTKLEKYNDKNYNNREKAKKTKLEKYNDKNYNNQEKAKKTKLEKYNDKNYNNREKYKNTLNEIYGAGVNSVSQIRLKNLDKIEDVDFILNNFVKDNRLQVKKLFSFFNIKCYSIHLRSLYDNLLSRNVKINSGGHSSNIEDYCLDKTEALLNRELNRQFRIKYDKKYFKVDGFDPETNTVYEFLGDFWHGNLNVFDKDTVNPRDKKYRTYGTLNAETFERLDIIKSLGYKVKYIWEADFNEKGVESWKDY